MSDRQKITFQHDWTPLFCAAGQIITHREKTFSPKQESQSRLSVAKGLSQELGLSLTSENLLFLPKLSEAIDFSAEHLDNLCEHLKGLITVTGALEPKFS